MKALGPPECRSGDGINDYLNSKNEKEKYFMLKCNKIQWIPKQCSAPAKITRSCSDLVKRTEQDVC